MIVTKIYGIMQRILPSIERAGAIAAKMPAIYVRIEQTTEETTKIDRKIGKVAKRVTAIIAETNNTAERTFPLVRVK